MIPVEIDCPSSVERENKINTSYVGRASYQIEGSTSSLYFNFLAFCYSGSKPRGIVLLKASSHDLDDYIISEETFAFYFPKPSCYYPPPSEQGDHIVVYQKPEGTIHVKAEYT